MTFDTIAYVPADADEADAIAKMLKSLDGSTIKLHSTAGTWLIVPIMRSWSVTDVGISIDFSPGVIETLGRDLNVRELLNAAALAIHL